MVKLPAEEPTYTEESSFEALILFNGDIFDILMNNTPIHQYTNTNPADLRVVNYVQV